MTQLAQLYDVASELTDWKQLTFKTKRCHICMTRSYHRLLLIKSTTKSLPEILCEMQKARQSKRITFRMLLNYVPSMTKSSAPLKRIQTFQVSKSLMPLARLHPLYKNLTCCYQATLRHYLNTTVMAHVMLGYGKTL